MTDEKQKLCKLIEDWEKEGQLLGTLADLHIKQA